MHCCSFGYDDKVERERLIAIRLNTRPICTPKGVVGQDLDGALQFVPGPETDLIARVPIEQVDVNIRDLVE